MKNLRSLRSLAGVFAALLFLAGCGHGVNTGKAGDQAAERNDSDSADVSDSDSHDPESDAMSAAGAEEMEDTSRGLFGDILSTEGKVFRVICPDDRLEQMMLRYYEEYTEEPLGVSESTDTPGPAGASESVEAETDLSSEQESAEVGEEPPQDDLPSENTDIFFAEDGVIQKTGYIGNMEVEWIIADSEDETAYEALLDRYLVGGTGLTADERADLFVIRTDELPKYCAESADVSMKLTALGIDSADLDSQYPFTGRLAADESGAVRAAALDVPTEIFVYRRGGAREVFGTDDPIDVEEAVSDWDAFDGTAAQMKKNGWYMLSGFTDTFVPYSSQAAQGWVDEENRIHVDQTMINWAHLTREETDAGEIRGTVRGSREWIRDLTEDQPVFGFFLTAEEIERYLGAFERIERTESGTESVESIPGNLLLSDAETADGGKAEAISGEWGACIGPSAASGDGGMWLCAASGSDNQTLAASIIRTFTMNDETMRQIALDTGYPVNNRNVMTELSGDLSCGNRLFGGQNLFAVFAEAGASCSGGAAGHYDRELGKCFLTAYLPYLQGELTEAEALNRFYSLALDRYPDLLD